MEVLKKIEKRDFKNFFSYSPEYRRFINYSIKLQKVIDEALYELRVWNYTEDYKNEVVKRFEITAISILKVKFDDYNDFVIMYEATFLHFPRKIKQIRFLK